MPEDEEENLDEVYDNSRREEMVENDEISPEEEGFMAGYEEHRERKPKNLEGDEAYDKAFESSGAKRNKRRKR